MAQLNGFNSAQVAPTSQQFDALPAGKYPVLISDSIMKPTKDGQGKYLELTFDVIDGPFKGRKLWERLNLENKNAKTVEIAYGVLSAICHAVGKVGVVNDSAELHNRPLLVSVSYKARPGSEPDQKLRYAALDGNTTVVPAAGQVATTAAAAPAAPPKKPWER